MVNSQLTVSSSLAKEFLSKRSFKRKRTMRSFKPKSGVTSQPTTKKKRAPILNSSMTTAIGKQRMEIQAHSWTSMIVKSDRHLIKGVALHDDCNTCD
jgi:hypothetical protein